MLKGHLENFTDIFLGLDETDQKKVFEVFVNNNAIEALLEGKRERVNCSIEDLHADIQEATDTLFKFMFKDTLKLDNKLKTHYKKLYDFIKKKHKKVCPFCGIETLVSPLKGMQDYDHLLYKDKYSMSSVNMRNLIPMGIDCNRRYKQTQDVITDNNGNGRKFFFPFNDIPPISVDLTNSPIPNDVDTGENWIIEFKPDMQEVETWAEVFDIRDRYKEDVFKVGFF